MSKSKKGGRFEREICKRLSLWWTAGDRDDVFWRSASSGARATVRGYKGKSTYGQYGDISATESQSEPFTQVFTTELKRGYSTCTPFDCLDKGPTAKTQLLETWLEKMIRTWKLSGSLGWLLITRRDKRLAIAHMPSFIGNMLRIGQKSYCIESRLAIRAPSGDRIEVEFVSSPLEHVLEQVTRSDIEVLAKL